MALVKLHRRSVFVSYKSNFCSKAFFFTVICIFVTVLGSYVIAFYAGDLWYKNNVAREQANVRFLGKVLLILEGRHDTYETNSTKLFVITWSTFSAYNQLIQQNLRSAFLKFQEDDLDKDGRFDQSRISIEIPLYDTEEVYLVKLLLFFDYKLQDLFKLQTETLGYLQYSSFIPGTELHAIADLSLTQRKAIPRGERWMKFNKTVVDENSFDLDKYNIVNILQSHQSADVHTKFSKINPVWKGGKSSRFKISVCVVYPYEIILYPFKQLKWAWIQYASIFVLLYGIFNFVKSFVFQNQLFSTIIETPWKAHIT